MATWHPVPGFPGVFVTRDGRLKSRLKRGAVSINKDGYRLVRYYAKQLLVHHAVLYTFRGPRPPGKVARHLNDIKLDNHLGNLRWGTYAQNGKDKVKNGRQQSNAGILNPNCKISENVVRFIRAHYRPYQRGRYSSTAMSKKFKITDAQVRNIAKGVSWTWNTGSVEK